MIGLQSLKRTLKREDRETDALGRLHVKEMGGDMSKDEDDTDLMAAGDIHIHDNNKAFAWLFGAVLVLASGFVGAWAYNTFFSTTPVERPDTNTEYEFGVGPNPWTEGPNS